MRRSFLFLAPLALLLVLVCGACGKAPEPATQQPPASAAEVRAHMHDHFGKVREVEEAVIRGDLDAAKAPALWIADHQETTGLPAGTESRVVEMKAAARSVASADNIPAAGIAAAALVGACGGCHATARVDPAIAQGPEQTAKGKRPDHMLEHQYAVDLMYHGLIAPASGDWIRGAEALKVAPLGAKLFPEVSADAVAAETRVHELAARAVEAPGLSTRVTIYGSLLGGCATCHAMHGRVWGPGLTKTE